MAMVGGPFLWDMASDDFLSRRSSLSQQYYTAKRVRDKGGLLLPMMWAGQDIRKSNRPDLVVS